MSSFRETVCMYVNLAMKNKDDAFKMRYFTELAAVYYENYLRVNKKPYKTEVARFEALLFEKEFEAALKHLEKFLT